MRRAFSTAFIIGGIITLLILLLLHAFAQAIGGMSAGSGSPPSPGDAVLISMICGYFFASAVGVFVSRSKSVLWVWAAFAHALLLVTYLTIFIAAKNADQEGYKWPSQAATLAGVMALYFAPWVTAWAVILWTHTRGSRRN